MDAFALVSDDEKRIVFEETSNQLNLSAISIEKDFWVCWILGELFALEGVGEALVFKGGTSLSKAWKLIDRFSEDIDIVIDRSFLGFGGNESPEKAPSKKQRRKRFDLLKEACRKLIAERLKPALSRSVEQILGEHGMLVADPDDVDGMTLLFKYASVYPDGLDAYIPREVKIEMGARSATWPIEWTQVVSYSAEVAPNYFEEPKVKVRVVAKERTCLDKLLLLHEENFRPPGKVKNRRLSRHYYDVYQLIKKGVAMEAVRNTDLLARVIEHRSAFFGYSWMDWEAFDIGDLAIQPKEETLDFWKADYMEMQRTMFFGDFPSFDEVLKTVKDFEERCKQ
ncbi:MAG: nucleotidyl transferase AbiEii/AbiGii toxin family protein [Verrucomicrobia bacterium]|nr:nucleotidyl transferase AbiEii/AbiGii toxin family protein [Verrucomicrobiota bacterium]MDA1065439.1 nucleotidyl transferase AbiEii/AbiGii toxin family protein [Verrucomicrobiota bacterium]